MNIRTTFVRVRRICDASILLLVLLIYSVFVYYRNTLSNYTRSARAVARLTTRNYRFDALHLAMCIPSHEQRDVLARPDVASRCTVSWRANTLRSATSSTAVLHSSRQQTGVAAITIARIVIFSHGRTTRTIYEESAETLRLNEFT